jgi:BASS family bile acid:Na+ symporter
VQDFLLALSNLFVMVFVVCSMLSLGMNLTVAQILESLQDRGLVIKALVANFVIVPILAYVILLIIPMEEGLKTGLICMATAAGAPFLPKLVQVAKGNIPFSVGLMVLLMVVTIIYMPIVMPLLLPGVTVDPLAIASSLIVTMLIPLAIGLFVKARYEETAGNLGHTFAQASNIALILMTVLQLGLNWRTILGTIGTGALIGAFILILGAVVSGYLLGGPSQETQKVVGLGTGQRNLSAAMLVATGNFTDPNVLNIIMVGSIVGLIILFIVAGELGKRSAPAAAVSPAPAAPKA